MRDITINNNGSQDENQKTTPVTESLFEPASSIHYLSGVIFSTWLGKRDGNITFDDSLDFDISEIESVYEDEGK